MDRIRTGTEHVRGARISGWAPGIAAAVLSAMAFAAPADALQLVVTDGGLTAPSHNFGCETSASDCNGERDFLLDQAGVALGSLEVVGNMLSFELSVYSVSFEDPGSGSVVSFSEVSYTGSAFALTSGDMATGFSIVVPLVGNAAVVGAFQTSDSTRGVIDPSTPFAVQSELLNFNCFLLNGTGQCGLQIGNDGFTLPIDGQDHDFVHTFNLTVIPEPSTASLVLFAGLAGLGLRRIRRA